jgi:hypothetical protein
LWLSLTSVSAAQALVNQQTPDLPSACDGIQVTQTNQLMARVYAVGVQTYRWNGTSWVFVEPVATLYADANYHQKVGIHYAGPTWESNDGGKVVATRLYSCTPNPTAIPWLLLQTTSTDGTGPLSAVTFIQRVNTKGGLAPTAPGAATGVVAEVPYTTEYYFYRAKN